MGCSNACMSPETIVVSPKVSSEVSAKSSLQSQDPDPTKPSCGICLRRPFACDRLQTDCCGQVVCSACFAADCQRQDGWHESTCPYCRATDYTVTLQQEIAEKATELLDGNWEVRLTETSPLGTSSHKLAVSISGNGAVFGAGGGGANLMQSSSWGDLRMGHTPSGRSFTATQRMGLTPDWIKDSRASVLGSTVEGRLHGLGRATFGITLTLMDPRGETMNINLKADMTKRSVVTL